MLPLNQIFFKDIKYKCQCSFYFTSHINSNCTRAQKRTVQTTNEHYTVKLLGQARFEMVPAKILSLRQWIIL